MGNSLEEVAFLTMHYSLGLHNFRFAMNYYYEFSSSTHARTAFFDKCIIPVWVIEAIIIIEKEIFHVREVAFFDGTCVSREKINL